MAKWKAPADAGPGVSIGGQWFAAIDGIIETPDDANFAMALVPHGYVHVPPSAEEMALAAQAAADEAAARAEVAAAEALAAQEAADKAIAEADAAAAQGELNLTDTSEPAKVEDEKPVAQTKSKK